MALIDHEMPFGFAPAADDHGAAVLLARVGLGALAALPGLMVASLALSLPVAIPALLGAGFLAVSWALRIGSRRGAHAFTLAVLAGMVLAATLMTFSASGPAAPTTAALVPLFAAAPMGLRMWTERRRRVGHGLALYPAPLPQADFQGTGHGEIDRDEIPSLEIVETPDGLAPGPSIVFPTFSEPELRELPGEINAVGDALDFALRLVGADASRRSVTLVQACEPEAAVHCERRALRQILRIVGTEAIQRAEKGSEVRITVRNLRGAVLIRIAYEESEIGEAGHEGHALQTATRLVVETGGTLLCDRGSDERRISIRMPRAAASNAVEGQHARGSA